jgi:DNA polymerase III sliding clamp (beta) subunit (PCNA family)
MRFEITAGQLRHLMSLSRQAIATTPSLMAYSGVQLVVAGDILQVVGSDGETTISANGVVSNAEAGSVLLLPKPLATYLGTLPADQLLVLESSEHGEELLVGVSGATPYRFRTMATSYPQTPLPQGETREVDLSGLAAAVTAVRTAASRENPIVQVVSSGDGLVLNATDNYRLVRAELPQAGFGSFTGVLGLGLLERLAKMDIRTITVDSTSRLISFASPQARVVTRVLAVPFPAVDSVLSARPTLSASLPSQAILAACSRLSAVSDTAPVRCSIEVAGLLLEVSNADLGSGREIVVLPGGTDRAPIEFMVRLAYLSDAITAAGSDTVEVNYSGPLQPLFFSPAGSRHVTTVVMPVRV